MSSNFSFLLSDLRKCNDNSRRWFVFIMIDLIIYFGGLILVFSWKWCKLVCCKKSNSNIEDIMESPVNQIEMEDYKTSYKCFVLFRRATSRMISTQYKSGKILLFLSTVATVISVILYLIEMYPFHVSLERCYPLKNPIFLIDLACNVFFLIHFLLRFIGNNEKILFWLSIYTIIDLFTIPQILVSVLINREWIGLRFLRIVAINRLQTVLQSFNLIKSATISRVTELITLFITNLVIGAGFVHLLENSGELTFSSSYKDVNHITYWNSLYYIVVTLSTVGYGDYSTRTLFGKIFISLFILVALAIFASLIPELAEFLFSQSQYKGRYRKENEKKHVIVCGNINYASASTFLADFFHEDRCNFEIEVVFVNREQPDPDMKSLLKSYFTKVKYYEGTVMSQNDLIRVQLHSANACLVLANQNCSDPNDEDAGNIMRAISIKNNASHCPVIIQLLQFENRVYLETVPNWDESLGDRIICYSEIELGIIAQSCLVPGFSTMLVNLFSVRSLKDAKYCRIQKDSWRLDYLHGISMEIYSTRLSPSFENMTYREVVEFCFKNLNLMLLAIESTDGQGKKILLMNPLNLKRIPKGAFGYFICDSYSDAVNAKIYCNKCHAAVRNLNTIKPCSCNDHKTPIGKGALVAMGAIDKMENLAVLDECVSDITLEFMDEKEATKVVAGTYQCEVAPKIQKCVISSSQQANELTNHIILCIFSDNESTSIGLKNFLTPLRNNTIPQSQLQPVLLIVKKELIENEWSEIGVYPQLKIVYLQSSIKKITELIGIERCARCVILNANSKVCEAEKDLYMVDKEVIIANWFFQAYSRSKLGVNLMNTSDSSPPDGDDKYNSVLMMGKNNSITIELENDNNDDNDDEDNNNDCKKCTKNCVSILSKLAIESNIQYLDVKKIKDLKMPNFLRRPFAFGNVFTANMLDSLMSTAFFDPTSIRIMEMLITGGCIGNNCNDVSTVSAAAEDSRTSRSRCNRFQIILYNVTEINKNIDWTKTIFYRDLFIEALNSYSFLCFGLYRKLSDNSSNRTTNRRNQFVKENRYVITNPPSTLPVSTSDQVYCLINEGVQVKQQQSDSASPPLCETEVF